MTKRKNTPAPANTGPKSVAEEKTTTAKARTAAHRLEQERTGEETDKVAGPEIEDQRPLKTGTATVTVALKMPNGIVMQAFAPHRVSEPVLGGGTRESTVHRPIPNTQYTLNGNRVPVVEGVVMQPNYRIIGGIGIGYALTAGIPREVWQKWREQNADSNLLANNLIMAFERQDEIEAFARNLDNVKQRSGLEPVRQKNEPRATKRKKRDGSVVDVVGIADEQLAAQQAM